MTPAERIVSHYGGDWRGTEGNIAGEGHSNGDRSVSIKDAPNRPDAILVCVRGRGNFQAEMDRFRRDGLLPDRRVSLNGTAPRRENWSCTGIYEYDNGAGEVVYRTRRLECTGKPKKFVAERFECGAWINGLGDIDRLPYRFTAIREAAARARETGEAKPPIYFVEGERKADKLADMGFLATAVAFGANGWRESYGEAFRDAIVVILPDNDDPGRKFAETVKSGIEEFGGTGHIIELPGLSPKSDIIDWHGTADDLRGLTDRALGGSLLPLPTLDLASLASMTPKAKQFAVEQVAPLGEVTLFTGPGSAGKSLLGQQLATCAAAGLPCLGLDVMATPAIYLTCEDDAGQLHWRQAHLCDALGVPMLELTSKLHLVSLKGALDNDLAIFTAEGTLAPTAAFKRLRAMVQESGSKLVILDNVAHLFTGNENARGDVTRFVNLLNGLALNTGAAVLLLGHPNKSGDSYSGSTAWLNAVRSHVTINHEKVSNGGILDLDARVLAVGKANYAQTGEVVRFRWHQWAFVLETDLSPDARSELADINKANGDNHLFLECLAERTRQHRAVSEKRSSTFAPTVFATMPESNCIGKARLDAAMDRLFRIGKIERAELWRGDDRKPVFGLRETAGHGLGNAEEMADLRAGDGADDTVRATRETVSKPAQFLGGDALNTHSYTSYKGRGPSGTVAPLQGQACVLSE